MVQIAPGWDLDVDRGPDWLFVRPHRHQSAADMPPLAEQVWSLMEQSLAHCVVLELDELDYLNTYLIGQLVWLHKRVHTHEGLMRVCGLSQRTEEVLRQCRLDSRFPSFANREAAVMGYRPRQPR